MKKRKKKLKIGIIFFFLGLGILALGAVRVYADVAPDDSQIIDVLSKNRDFFVQNDIIKSAFRYLEWLLVSLLQFICNQAEKVYLYSYKLLSFGTGTEVEAFVASLSPIYKTLLILSITAVGLMTMFLSIKLPDVFKNIALSVGIITCMFYVMSQLNLALYNPDTEEGLVTWALGGQGSITNDIVRTNVYDLYYIDGLLKSDEPNGGLAGFTQDSLEDYHYEQLSDEDMKKIDIAEVIDFEDEHLSPQAKKLLSKKLLWFNGTEPEYALVDVSEGFSMFGLHNFGNSFYYRYKVNFFDIVITLLAFTIVYFAVSYRVVQVIWQMVISRILAVLYSADITGRRKTMLLVNCIKDGYIVLFIAAITIRMFSLFQAYISQTFEDNSVVNVIILILLAFAVAKGGVEEKVTGYSLGAAGGFGLLYGGVQLAKGAGSILKGGARGIGKAADKIKNSNPFGKGTYSSYNPSDMPGTGATPGINGPTGSGGGNALPYRVGKTTDGNATATEGQKAGFQKGESNDQNENKNLNPRTMKTAAADEKNSTEKGNVAANGQGMKGGENPLESQKQKNGSDIGNVETDKENKNPGQGEKNPLNEQSQNNQKRQAMPSTVSQSGSVLDNVNERNRSARLNGRDNPNAAQVLKDMNEQTSGMEKSKNAGIASDILPSSIAEDEAYNVDEMLSKMDSAAWNTAFSGQQNVAQGEYSMGGAEAKKRDSLGTQVAAGPGTKNLQSRETSRENISVGHDISSLAKQDTRNHVKQPTQIENSKENG